jgi:hypothetical protein
MNWAIKYWQNCASHFHNWTTRICDVASVILLAGSGKRKTGWERFEMFWRAAGLVPA